MHSPRKNRIVDIYGHLDINEFNQYMHYVHNIVLIEA